MHVYKLCKWFYYVKNKTIAVIILTVLCRDSEKEWYYTGKDKERQGPYSFKEMRDLWTEQEIHTRTRYVFMLCACVSH